MSGRLKHMLLKIIIASVRPGRVGESIADWFTAIAKKDASFEIEVIDLAKINLPPLDEPELPRFRKYTKKHTKEWSKIIDEGEAFVFVTPEYNYGYPSSLKNAIDYLHYEWGYKPMGFVSYGGTSGGTRSVQQLKQIVTSLNMMPIPEAVTIPMVFQYLDKAKKFVGNETFEQSAEAMVKKLYVWAKHMKSLREEVHKSE